MRELDELLDEYKEIESNIKAVSKIQGYCAEDPLVQMTLSSMTPIPNKDSYSVSTISLSLDGIAAIKVLNIIMNRQVEVMDEVVQKLNKLRYEDRSSNPDTI